MGSVIENEKTKAKCQIFTPDNIVKTMLDHVGYVESLYGKTVLENSCGNGQFLKEIVKRYISDGKRKGLSRTKIKNGLGRDIFGTELDPLLHQECINNLNSITDSFGLKRVHWQIKRADALREPYLQKFSFMKLSNRGEGPYYYKTVSRNRKIWMENHGGLKIYRDNFLVRPYGDPTSKSFDWLGLDARKGVNPVAISDKSEQWHVNNSQLQGTVLISRVYNGSILDKSSREGIIENEFFDALSSLLVAIISIFEKDRAHIVKNIKLYNDHQNQRERAKEEAVGIAKTVLGKKNNKTKEKTADTASDTEKLATAVQIYQEEREELISEIKLLRALATNGLMTTTMVHDLKSINALLVSRVRGFKLAIRQNDTSQIQRNLDDLKTNDEFLKSWITVITTQTKKDRRRRLKKDIYKVLSESLKLISPILNRKMVKIQFDTDDGEAYKKIFATDFDSIIYNLVINSIESFEGTKVSERQIAIRVESDEDSLTIHYCDNGHGLTEVFKKKPYSIFEYGTTSKFDAEGNAVGTGLGMYIVASSINEYKGRYTITKVEGGFGLDITIPLSGEGR